MSVPLFVFASKRVITKVPSWKWIAVVSVSWLEELLPFIVQSWSKWKKTTDVFWSLYCHVVNQKLKSTGEPYVTSKVYWVVQSIVLVIKIVAACFYFCRKPSLCLTPFVSNKKKKERKKWEKVVPENINQFYPWQSLFSLPLSYKYSAQILLTYSSIIYLLCFKK